MNEKNEQTTSTELFRLADRLIGLVSLIVTILGVLAFSVLLFYLFLLVQPDGVMRSNSRELHELIVRLLEQITPYIAQFLRLLAPIFVLIFTLGVLHRLGKEGANPFNTSKLVSDLPSALALLIIATICLLPLAGLEVPSALNNIALVVVGFYFGKRKTSDE